MATKLGGLLAGIKKAVIDAQHSVADQHINELKQFFVAEEGQSDNLIFPDGSWDARTVTMNVPREVSRNGVVSTENHKVLVPLITLLPLRSHLIDRVEVLTTLDVSIAELNDEIAGNPPDLANDVLVSVGSKGPNASEIKIIVVGADLPQGYARLVSAYEKLLNAQLPT